MSEKETKKDKSSKPTSSKDSKGKGKKEPASKDSSGGKKGKQKKSGSKGGKKKNKKGATKRKYTRKSGGKKRRKRKGRRGKSEFDQKILDIRRVTRVVAGGRRFSFSVTMVIGNRKGSVGVGLGKANDTSLAIEKAHKNAKKNLIQPKLTKDMSIPFDVKAKYTSSEIMMAPAPGGGLKAGSSVRTVLELLGATDISAKVLSRSKNKLNNARAAVKALKKLNINSPVKDLPKAPGKKKSN